MSNPNPNQNQIESYSLLHLLRPNVQNYDTRNSFPFRFDIAAATYAMFIAMGVGTGIPMYIWVGWAPAIAAGIVGFEVCKARERSAPVPTQPLIRRAT